MTVDQQPTSPPRTLQFPDDHFLVTLGLEVEFVESGVDGRAPVRPESFAPGTTWIRGGVLAALVDLMAGHVPYPTSPTVDLSLTVLERPPSSGTVRCEARAIRVAPKTAVSETRLYAGEAAEPFAIGVTTYFLASERTVLAISRPQMMPVWGGSFDAFLDVEVLGPDSISVPLVPRFQNSGPNSPMHGGLQSLLAEVASAHCFGSGRPMVATAIDLRYLTAVTTGPVVAHTTGQRLSNGDVRAAVRMVDAGDGDRLATYASLTLHPVVD